MVVVPLRADILDNDLLFIYIAGRIGMEHGWSHIYSLPLQHELFMQLRPHVGFNDGDRYLSPPPYAWLVLPLAVFGAAGAVKIWLAISALALAGAWWLAAPGTGWLRALWLLGACAWYPVLYSLSLAQPDVVVILIAAVAWRLAEAKRPYAAGVVLALCVLKPQLILLLPLVLLTSGRWRITIAWGATTAVLALVSLLAIGGEGLADYRALLSEAQHIVNNRYFTLAYLLGPGVWSSAAQIVVAVAAAFGGYLNRRSSDARIFALGIVATTLSASYWHLQDYAILVLAAWLFCRDAAPAWQRGWLLVIALAGELAWPLTPLPMLVAIAVWFVCLVLPRLRTTKTALA